MTIQQLELASQHEVRSHKLGESPVQQSKSKRILYWGLVSAFLLLALSKLGGLLTVSWWWISLPLWAIPAGYGLLIVVIILICLGQELNHRLRIRR